MGLSEVAPGHEVGPVRAFIRSSAISMKVVPQIGRRIAEVFGPRPADSVEARAASPAAPVVALAGKVRARAT